MTDNLELHDQSAIVAEQSEDQEAVQEARDIMAVKLEHLQNVAGFRKKLGLDMARAAAYLSLDQIEALGEYALEIDTQKLAVIGKFLTHEQIHYIGPNFFVHDHMTPEKIQLLSKFTIDQLEAFCIGDVKGGEILFQLDVGKINDLGRLSPETIFVLAHSKRKELIMSSAESREWKGLMDYNIDYPQDL